MSHDVVKSRIQVSDVEMLAALKEAAKIVPEDGTLTCALFDEWRGSFGETKPPSISTITSRFGSWTKACNLAGVRVQHRRGTAGRPRFSDESIYVALERCWRDLGHRPQVVEYNEWRNEQPDRNKLMTGGTILRSIRGFKTACAEVEKRMALGYTPSDI